MDNITFEKITLPEEHREELESVGSEAHEKQIDYAGRGIIKERKDIFKEVLGERASTGQASQGQANSTTTQTDDNTVDMEKIEMMSKSEKLQELVNIAATKGPVQASLMARKIGDPWLEDQFHDTLISFHDELVRRKKLKEE